MKLSIILKDQVLTRPADIYSTKEEATVVDIESMEADHMVVAALLRGIADKIDPKRTINVTSPHISYTQSGVVPR